jgi:serine/threonine protein kinase
MSSDRYEIRGKIGQGGVGAVYRAYDTQLRREVAMKRVLQDGEMNTEDATANLLKEATALSSVQHPHIVTVYDAGIDAEGPYVVMELINGKTLDEMVERGTLTFEDFKEVALQSQEAMIAAQDLNLVHRDLKPSNVMVSWLPSGRFQVKIVDFGLAKFSAKPSLQTIDHGDAVFGSIFFMAPEQFERTPLDRRTDMYSLGAMYYYALSGEYPFNGDTAPQVMAAHLQNKVIPLIEVRPDLPPWLCDWVMWHIRRDMNDRPESARVSLEHFLAHDSAHTLAITQSQPYAMAPNQRGQRIVDPSGQLSPHTTAHMIKAGNLNSVQLVTGAPTLAVGQIAAPSQPQQQAVQNYGGVRGAQYPQEQQGQQQQYPSFNQKPAKSPLLIVIAVLLVVLIIVVLILILGKGGSASQKTKINELYKMVDVSGSKKKSVSHSLI